jgi:hypothetical protein
MESYRIVRKYVQNKMGRVVYLHNGISILGVKIDLGKMNSGAYFDTQFICKLGLVKALNSSV